MSRDKPITIYVSEDEKKHLQSEADQAGETLSSYIYKHLQESRHRENLDRAATEQDAEERIEALIRDAKDTLEEIARDTKDMNARAGAYAIANFELLKQNYPDARRKEVLQTGAKRLRYPLEDHADLQDTPADDDDSDDENDENDGTTEVDDLL